MALIILLLISLLFRIIRIDYPKAFVFDEVYYAFTAQEYLKGNPNAWVWWGNAPEGRAYGWVNPPLPQEIMAASMFIFNSTDAWAWRLPGIILGVLAIYLVFEISKLLFKNESAAFLSAFVFSTDGLNFVQSRIGMLDIYLVSFILLGFLFLLKKRWVLSAIFLGLAISSKWTAIFALILFTTILIKNRQPLKILYFIIILPVIYLTTYLPFFLTEHTIPQFIELVQQEVWYHTNLKTTHDYASPWWSWPISLYPVWYYVEYFDNSVSSGNKIANIFSGGNPTVFWFGTVAIILTIWETFKTKSASLLIILLGFLIFWLPWALSQRIMFLYYFSPAVPFMSIALGYQLTKLSQTPQKRKILLVILTAISISFLLLYPFLTGIAMPKEWIGFFFLTNFAKHPF